LSSSPIFAYIGIRVAAVTLMARWMALAVVFGEVAASVAGCSSGLTASDNRFNPGAENDMISKEAGAGSDCDAAVCSPKPIAQADAGPTLAASPDAGNTCDTKSTCATATDLGAVKGDDGDEVRTREGAGSAFFTIKVTQTLGYWQQQPLSVAFTLLSAKSTKYELYVYEDTTCTAVFKSSALPLGTTEKVSDEWGHSMWSDNAHEYRIEVRKVSDTCDPTDHWTLLVEGHTAGPM
jgi:hypothetical protein